MLSGFGRRARIRIVELVSPIRYLLKIRSTGSPFAYGILLDILDGTDQYVVKASHRRLFGLFHGMFLSKFHTFILVDATFLKE